MRLDERSLFYERFADEFDDYVNMYDVSRRVGVVFDELLGPMDLKGQRLLDAGCGTGWFSQEAVKRGAAVTALDLGPKLLIQTRRKSGAGVVQGSALELPFLDGSFDFVVSSEMIEHTPTPRQAVHEMLRVCKKGGWLAFTTPNRRWKPALWLANALGVRKYDGYENWSSQKDLRQWVATGEGSVEKLVGLHAFPFVIKFTHPLLRRLDFIGEHLPGMMVNLCVLARK